MGRLKGDSLREKIKPSQISSPRRGLLSFSKRYKSFCSSFSQEGLFSYEYALRTNEKLNYRSTA